MDLSADLAEHLEGQYALPEDEAERERFRFDCDSKADWGLRMLAKNQAQQAEVLALAQEEHDLINQWVGARLDALREAERFFQGGVTDYWRRQLEPEVEERLARGMNFDDAWEDVRVKSRKLPHGSIAARRGTTKVVLEDVTSFVAWARANGRLDLLTTPEPAPAKAAIAKLPVVDGSVVVDGEKLPGVRIEDPGVRYSAVPS